MSPDINSNNLKISVRDILNGCPAEGLEYCLSFTHDLDGKIPIKDGMLSSCGSFERPLIRKSWLKLGNYTLKLFTGEYFCEKGVLAVPRKRVRTENFKIQNSNKDFLLHISIIPETVNLV